MRQCSRKDDQCICSWSYVSLKIIWWTVRKTRRNIRSIIFINWEQKLINMVPFCISFENGIHLSKLNYYWNISSRYIPHFLMCFGTLPASTITSAYFPSSLSHSLCIGLPFLLDEVRWTAFFSRLSILLSGSVSGGLHISFQISQIVPSGPSCVWSGIQFCHCD